MPNIPNDLEYQTDPSWAAYIVDHFDLFVADHANCERKASAMATGLIVKYPDRTKIISPMIKLALEELQHFQQVYKLMEQRNIPLVKDTPDPYISSLMELARHGRDERFLDRLLISSVVESRGAERFQLVSDQLTDRELKQFYSALAKSESKHGDIFSTLACHYFDHDIVFERMKRIIQYEASIVSDLEWRPALH